MSKVLVIEDEEAIREIIDELLTAENYQVSVASNGNEGLELALSKLPDLIICDVMMPEMDGYQVLEQLRKNVVTETIPFIFLTAKASQGDLREGMNLGADDYLTKPFKRQELLRAVTTRLGKQQAIEKRSQHYLNELRNNLSRALPHELRTPLNGIISSADILREYYDSMDQEEIKEMADMIKDSAQRLYELIQKFLLYSKLEIITAIPEESNVILAGETDSTELIVESIATEKSKECQRQEDLNLELTDCQIAVAENWFMIIVKELVDNAFKYSELGNKVILKTILVPERKQMILQVEDRGRGMTQEQLKNIGPYMQFDRDIYEQQGAGLGLSICKRLVEMYSGSFSIESTHQESTIVSIALPVMS